MRSWSKGIARILKVEQIERSYAFKGVRRPYYVPRVEYAFEVSGHEYRGSRFSVHNFVCGTRDEIFELLRGAKPGDEVDVYYDPHDPREAVLTLPGYEGVVGTLFVGVFILGLVALVSLAK
jgi:hypothetical protein